MLRQVLWFSLSLCVLLQLSADPRTAFFNDALSLKDEFRQVVAVADFNGDGKVDLLRRSDTGLSLLPGNGGLTFGTPVNTVIADLWDLRTVGDVNADGRPDLFYTVGTEYAVVLLAGASGQFSTSDTLALTGNAFHLVAFADVTGDGKPDVLLANQKYEARGMFVYPGDGSGAFGSPGITITDDSFSSLDVADVNGDGRADAAFLDNGTLWLRLAQASGWSARMSLGAASSHVFGDFDGDGDSDIATGNRTLLGNGDGTFAQGTSYASPVANLTATDIEEDGDLDLIAHSDGFFQVLLNAGDATFTGPIGYAADADHAADLDGDGDLDVFDAGVEGMPPQIVLGNGDGTFDVHTAYRISDDPGPCGSWTNAIASGDVTGDGKADIITFGSVAGAYAIAVLPSLGDGRLGPRIGTPVSYAEPLDLAAGHFDSDALTDLAVLTSPGAALEIYLANGDGTFRRTANVQQAGLGRLSVHDFTGDGKRDVAVIGVMGIKVYAGDGAGSLAAAVQTAVNTHWEGAIADLNGDGDPDLVAFGAGARVHLGSTGATFGAAGAPFDPDYHLVALGDLDGDGTVDLLTRTNEVLRLRRGGGDATFGPPHDISVHPSDFRSGEVVDADGDGRNDLVTWGAVLFGDADQPFGGSAWYGPAGFFALADLDANGSLDVVTQGCPFVTVRLTRTAVSRDLPATLQTQPPFSVMYGQVFGLSEEVLHGTIYRPGGGMRMRVDGKLAALSHVYDGFSGPTFAFGIGTYTLDADYGGDHLFGSAAGTRSIVVNKAATVTSSPPPPPSPAGTTVNLTVMLRPFSAVAPGFAAPSGTITLREGSAILATRPAVPFASLAVNGLPPGHHQLTVQYGGDANYLGSSANVEVLVSVPFGSAMTVAANAKSASSIAVSWTPVTEAVSYDVYRRIGSGGYALAATVAAPSWTDGGRASGTTHLYKVLARNSANETTPLSAPDLATTLPFTDPSLTALPVKLVHATELRSAINAVRAAAGMGAFTFAQTPAAGSVITASQLAQMRSALSEARTALGFATSFTDATPATIRAVHFQELREGTQ